ncbi:DH domain-containing protein [Entamoeba marina]
MEKDYWVAPLSEKEQKVFQTLFLSLRSMDKFQKALVLIRSSAEKETLFQFLLKVKPQLLTDLLKNVDLQIDILTTLYELCDIESADKSGSEYAKHLIKYDSFLIGFISQQILETTDRQFVSNYSIKNQCVSLLVVLSVQFDDVAGLEPCVPALLHCIDSSTPNTITDGLMILTNILQPNATRNRLQFIRGGGIQKVISLLNLQHTTITYWCVSLVYQLLAEGSDHREIYVRQLIEKGFFDAVSRMIGKVRYNIREQLLKIIFVVVRMGFVQQILEENIFFLQPLSILYTVLIIQECSSSKGGPIGMREIGLSAKLCDILSHIQETTKQIIIAVLSSIFNLLVDEEMIQEFRFFGVEKQIANLKSLDPEFTSICEKIENRLRNYQIRTQVISAMVNKLQQPDKIEIDNLRTVVNAVAENKTFSENNLKNNVDDLQNKTIVDGIDEILKNKVELTQPIEAEESVDDSTIVNKDIFNVPDTPRTEYVKQIIDNGNMSDTPRVNNVDDTSIVEQKTDEETTNENKVDDEKNQNENVVNDISSKTKSDEINEIKQKKPITKSKKQLSIPKLTFQNQEFTIKSSLTPRRDRRKGITMNKCEISEYLKQQTNEEDISLQQSPNEISKPQQKVKRRESSVISVTHVKKPQQQESKDEKTVVMKNTIDVEKDQIEHDKIREHKDEQQIKQNFVDLKTSFSIPKFKYICRDELVNEDQAKIVADLNLKKAKRKFIILELINTENTYVTQLEECISLMYEPLSSLLSKEELQTAFNCLPEICSINKHFNDNLQQRMKEETDMTFIRVSDLFIEFLQNTATEKYYSEYLITGDDAIEYPFDTKGDAIKQMVIKWTNDCKIPANYLIQPVQRFPRYVMLLESLIKTTPEITEEYHMLQIALEKVKNLTKSIDFAKNKYIQQKKAKYYSPFMTSTTNIGNFIYDGVVTMKDIIRYTATAVLFEKMIFFLIEKKGKFTMKYSSEIKNIKVTTKIKKENYLIILSLNSSKTTLIMHFHCEIDFENWNSVIQKTINDYYC